MTAQIIDLSIYRATHPKQSVRLRFTFDPLWPMRLWLSFWGIR